VSLAIYIAALTLSFGFHLPNLHGMGGLMRELVALSEPIPVAVGAPEPMSAPTEGLPAQAVKLERRGRLAGIYGATPNLAIVSVVILMIWKPGS
jgi:hypothetical protein